MTVSKKYNDNLVAGGAVRDGNGNRIDTTYAKIANLASVATSGSYNDLTNKPVVDQNYDGTSANAQSGIAVEQAINTVKRNIDGQWVQSFITLISSSNTINGVQIDLSSYLPDDGYNYNVKFNLKGHDDDSSYYYHIETDIFDDGNTSTGNSNYVQIWGGGNSRHNMNTFDLPVGIGRYIKVYGSGADNIYVYALGYRRLGTNS